MQGFLKPYQVEQIKKKYPVGTRIQLDHMEGERDMPQMPQEEAPADYEPMNLYVDYINANVLPKVNYERLQADYGTEEKAYAKSVLNALHQGVFEVYGTETFGRETAGGYVLLPGVVQSKNTGELCIALLELDLQSSGEHCATDFLIRYGCISQFEEMQEEVQRFLKDTYGAYEYGYTATLTDDIHVDKARLPYAGSGKKAGRNGLPKQLRITN